MPIVLFVIGAIALILGVGAVGYGIPINKSDFGNTLIIAGTTAAVGGLILVGLGAVVSKLQRIGVALAVRPSIRSNPAFNLAQAPAPPPRAALPPGRIPFPPRPKSETVTRGPPAEAPAATAAIPPEVPETYPASSGTPSLRNPGAPAMRVEEEVALSPSDLRATSSGLRRERNERAAAPMTALPATDESGTGISRRGPALDFPSTPPAETAYFETLWPAEPEPAAPTARGEGGVEPRPSEPPPEPAAYFEAETPPPLEQSEPRAVAILKSGVVDGMSYTLYVDGSIEAELPRGKLRFASINKLRQHLEKNS